MADGGRRLNNDGRLRGRKQGGERQPVGKSRHGGKESSVGGREEQQGGWHTLRQGHTRWLL